MYCILNQSNDIIASDLEFLKLFGANSLVELYKKITAEDAKISLDYDKITLAINNDIKMYDIKVTPITTLFGKSVLVELMSTNTKNEFVEVPGFAVETPSHAKQEDTHAAAHIPEVVVEPIIATEESLAEETSDEEKTISQSILAEEVIEPALELENLEEATIQESVPKEVKEKENKECFIDPKITLNIPEIAQSMHLSEGDYSVFLNEYTSSIDKFKKDLGGSDTEAKSNAINFIKHITTALYLPKDVENLVNSLKVNSSKKLFQNFFDVVNNIKEQNTQLVTPVEEEVKIENIAAHAEETAEASSDELSIDIFHDTKPAETIQIEQYEIALEESVPAINIGESIEIDMSDNVINEQPKEQEPEKTTAAQTVQIDLSNIKPIPFDFILDESAKELSLPVDIVKEFIKDFIEQCYTDTDKIIHKFEEGDIDKIKKLAHSLKGVASNLYIMPLADTLLDLQNNDGMSNVKPLVEKYWGQFLYLENIMKNI